MAASESPPQQATARKPVQYESRAISGIEYFWMALDHDHRSGNPFKVISARTGEHDPDPEGGGISEQTLQRFHKGTLRDLTPRQLAILAKMYKIQISMPGYTHPGFWDAMFNPDQMTKVIELRKKHEQDAKEVNGYAEFLTCSFETKEFMEEHHAAIFKDVFQSTAENRQNLIQAYNTFGDFSQKRFHDPTRRFTFTQMIYAQKLRDIAEGNSYYRHIPQVVRTECLKKLRDMLKNSTKKMGLVIAEQPVRTVTGYLPSAESLFITDRKLAVWRTRFGSMYWTENPTEVSRYYELLAKFREHAEHNSNRAAAEFLSQLLAKL